MGKDATVTAVGGGNSDIAGEASSAARHVTISGDGDVAARLVVLDRVRQQVQQDEESLQALFVNPAQPDVPLGFALQGKAVTQRTATRITPRTLDGTSLDG